MSLYPPTLKSVRSVTDQWHEVKAEHVERWREAALDMYVSGYKKDPHHWMSAPPPDVPLMTGVTLSEAQARAFAEGDTWDVQKMTQRFVADVFGPLTPTSASAYIVQDKIALPGKTQFASLKWHRDPPDVITVVASAMPTLFLRGGVVPPFEQEHTKNGYCSLIAAGQHRDIRDWAERSGNLVQAPVKQIVLSVGRHWHCPVENETSEPMSRMFMFGDHAMAPRRDDCFQQIQQSYKAAV